MAASWDRARPLGLTACVLPVSSFPGHLCLLRRAREGAPFPGLRRATPAGEGGEAEDFAFPGVAFYWMLVEGSSLRHGSEMSFSIPREPDSVARCHKPCR